MNLTEGQLFTIEALNRIEGFVWPDDMNYACTPKRPGFIWFLQQEPQLQNEGFDVPHGWAVKRDIGINHPDWRNSLITREQFCGVNGWVRSDGKPHGGYSKIDVMFESGAANVGVFAGDYVWSDGDIKFWRYHKPTKANEMKQEHPSALITDLLEQYTKKRNERERLQTEIECLQTEKDRVKDDEDKLIEQIRQWHLQYGFDIRVLDESDEVPEHEPELVITDWRDLRSGDVVEVKGEERVIIDLMSNSYGGLFRIAYDIQGSKVWSAAPWKFIRRPSKK